MGQVPMLALIVVCWWASYASCTPSMTFMRMQTDSGLLAQSPSTPFNPANITDIRLPSIPHLLSVQLPHAVNNGASVTLLASELLTGIVASTTTGAKAWTLPTAASLLAAFSTNAIPLAINDAFRFSIVVAATSGTITLSTNTGVTQFWKAASASTTSIIDNGLFIVRFTDVASGAYTIYRIG